MNAASTTTFMTKEGAGGLNTGGSSEWDKECYAHHKSCDQGERFLISACNMDIRGRPRSQEDVYKAMVDQGANVNLGPVRLAKALGLQIVPHTDGRKIGTADEDGQMEILGWIFPRGYTGPIAVVKKAAYLLLSVIQLQKHGVGVHCPPERPVCTLTILQHAVEVVFIEIRQTLPTNLYFFDIRELMGDYQPEYVAQNRFYWIRDCTWWVCRHHRYFS